MDVFASYDLGIQIVGGLLAALSLIALYRSLSGNEQAPRLRSMLISFTVLGMFALIDLLDPPILLLTTLWISCLEVARILFWTK